MTKLTTRTPFSRRRFGIALAWLSTVSVVGLSKPLSAQTVPKEFRIGWQKAFAIQALTRKKQVIERRLKTLGINSVKWVEFPSGPPLLEALGAGAIDIGVVGDTPPIFAQAAEANLVYAAATPNASMAVLVKKNSPIKNLADLKGKKVAFTKGSGAQSVTIKALAQVGLTLKDIKEVYLSPADATSAFNGGSIDAWTVWDPFYAIAENRYEARAITNSNADKRLASTGYYLANKDFSRKYPSVLTAVLDEIRTITLQAGENRPELAAVAAEATGVDEAIWKVVFDRTKFALGPVTNAHVASQQQLADTFYALGIIPKKINVADIVWRASK